MCREEHGFPVKKIAFFDAKPYDRIWFDRKKEQADFDIRYFDDRLTPDTAVLAAGCDAVCAFVNDEINAAVVDILYGYGIRVIAMRCAGYNNIDFKAAFGRIHVVRVPAYSPHAVAEHTAALMLTLNRRIHRAYNRTREGNFALAGLVGRDLHGRTAGVIGTGKIGRCFIDILHGFGMRVLAFDPFPSDLPGVEFVPLAQLAAESDVISLHCPLTDQTRHIINAGTLAQMKQGAMLLNTSRGALVDSETLLAALKEGRLGAAGLDVYEEESDVFFEDHSDRILADDTLARLISMPNVIVTSHQAFLTDEALEGIAEVTLRNLTEFFSGAGLTNEICYRCTRYGACKKEKHERCF